MTMSSLRVALLFTMFVHALSVKLVDVDPMIVGGTDAPVGMFPYIVSLQLNGNHFCGGSILNERWVVTAAHCVEAIDSLENLRVVAGSNTLTPLAEGGARYAVEKTIKHSQYMQLPITIMNDVGLIKVSQDMVFGDNVKAISVCDDQPPSNSLATLSGWGVVKQGDTSVPNNLQYLQYRTLSWPECFITQIPAIVWINFICVKNTNKQGACNGDSGGPLVYEDELIGITSWGTGCAVNKADVYTNACKYKSWMATQMSAN